MAIDLQQSLYHITTDLLRTQHPSDELKSAIVLSDFFSSHQTQQFPASNEKEKTEIFTPYGIAISPAEAANCITDHIRTVRFIKAVHAALHELTQRFPQKRLRVLYAGCGPYATLLLPVLPFFSPEQLEMILLEINPYSLGSAQQLIQQLGLDGYRFNFIASDATAYAAENRFHLIVTETMFQALIREPQVAVTENLSAQLLPGGIFLPEEIKVDAVCTWLGKEPFFKSNGTAAVLPQAPPFPLVERLLLGTVFSIGIKTDFSALTCGTSAQIESVYYNIPKMMNSYPDVCIFTQLRIFGTICLHPAESLITNPYCVASLANMNGCTAFQLIYNYRGVPGWTYKLKK